MLNPYKPDDRSYHATDKRHNYFTFPGWFANKSPSLVVNNSGVRREGWADEGFSLGDFDCGSECVDGNGG